jgi:glycosyltransferase involved in cell wall biosynthesis
MSTTVEVELSGRPEHSVGVADSWAGEPFSRDRLPRHDSESRDDQNVLALFCFEDSESAVGQYVATIASAMVRWPTAIHIFSRRPFALDDPAIYCHAVDVPAGGTLLGQIQEFTRAACNGFLRESFNSSRTTVMGFEWSTIPAISLLHGIKNVRTMLSLHSLERQRSDLGNEVAQYIEETELTGLREAQLILVHNQATADLAKQCVPQCAEHIEVVNPMTPLMNYRLDVDPGKVKARFNIGPIDPTILFIGDLNEKYGPDLLMKAMPGVLREHPQARCVIVGDGDLIWPLRVYSRYLLLDHAVRLVGHVDGQALYELIAASDVIVLPNRQSTPWWPIEAAWAAARPVVATQEAAPELLHAGHDSVVVAADEKAIAAGINQVLANADLGHSIGRVGKARIRDHYGVKKVVARIELLMGIGEAVEQAAGA